MPTDQSPPPDAPTPPESAATFHIEEIALERINPAPYNPRKKLKPGDKEYGDILASLRRFGIVQNLIWNRRTGNLVAGHQRLNIGRRELGWKTAPCRVIDVDLAEEKALNIAMNRLGEGLWSTNKLADLLKELQATARFDLTALGFTETEVETLLKTKPQKTKRDPDDAPPPPPGEAEGFDTHAHTMTTWAEKRIILNEVGIENAIRQIKQLPPPRHSFHAIMGGDYNGFDLIPTIRRLSGKPLRGLHIATLGFNKRNNLQLCRMMDTGEIEGPVVVIASLYFANSDAGTFNAAKHELQQRGSILVKSRNHAKIIACLTGEDAIVNETSANLRSCNALEQFALFNDRDLYDFHSRWIAMIADKHRDDK